MVLRIEDLDTARCPRRYADQMEDDLRWMGLSWDEGPGTGGPDGPYYQSERTALYQAALEKLEQKGLVYPCFCTRAELHAASAPHREDGQVVYAGTCRNLTAAEAAEKAKKRIFLSHPIKIPSKQSRSLWNVRSKSGKYR